MISSSLFKRINFSLAIPRWGLAITGMMLVMICSQAIAVDADLDGVEDYQDNCTNTPNGTLLPDAGGNSQLDTDGDGDFNNNSLVDPTDCSTYRLILISSMGPQVQAFPVVAKLALALTLPSPSAATISVPTAVSPTPVERPAPC